MSMRRFCHLLIPLALLGLPAGPVVHAQSVLSQPLNNASSTLAANHAIGSGTLVLKTGEGTRFGTPSPSAPVRVTVARKSTLVGGLITTDTAKTIFLATGRTGDTLTGLTATEGTADQAFFKNDPIAVLITAGTLTEMQTVVTSAADTANTAADLAMTAAASVDAKADDAAVVHLTGAETIGGTKAFSAKVTAPTVDHGTQAGTNTAPVVQTLHRIAHPDPAKGAFSTVVGGGMSGTVYDPIIYHGFNLNVDTNYVSRTDQPTASVNIEYDWFEAASTKRLIEHYIDLLGAIDLGANRWNVRPYFISTDRDTGSTRFHIQLGRKQTSFSLFDINGGYRTFGPPATNTEFQIFKIVGGDTIDDTVSEFLGDLTVDGALNLNSLTDVTTIAGSLHTGTSSAVETYIGPTQYNGFGQIIIGLSQRLGNFNTLIGHNLVGVNGSTNYVTPSTSTPWSGYGGIEFGSTGDIKIFANSGATTAGTVVTPTSRLTISGSNGAITVGNTFTINGLQNGNFFSSNDTTTGKAAKFGQNDSFGFFYTESASLLIGVNGNLSTAVAIAPGGKLAAGRGGLGSAAAMVEAVAPDTSTNMLAGYTSGNAVAFQVGPAGQTTIGAGGTPVLKVLSASGTLDFPSTAAQTSSDLTLTVTGAAVGDVVALGLPAAPSANTGYSGFVSAADTVKVRFNNFSAGAVDPASATYRVQVTKF